MLVLKKYQLGIILFTFLVTVQLIDAQDSSNTELPQKTIIPEDLTALDVISIYVEASGGKDNYINVHDRTTMMTGKMMNREFSVQIQQKAPDKLRQEVHAGPAKQTFIFDGTKGVMKIGDNSTPLEGNELNRTKIEAQMNFLLDPPAYGVKMEFDGVEEIDSTKCYKISMMIDSSTTWIQYYDVNSGLKTKELRDVEMPQGKYKQETYYDDYRDVDGIKYPFKIKQIIGTQSVEMRVDSIKVNTGLNDKLFEISE